MILFIDECTCPCSVSPENIFGVFQKNVHYLISYSLKYPHLNISNIPENPNKKSLKHIFGITLYCIYNQVAINKY